jgi:hypothetical protein
VCSCVCFFSPSTTRVPVKGRIPALYLFSTEDNTALRTPYEDLPFPAYLPFPIVCPKQWCGCKRPLQIDDSFRSHRLTPREPCLQPTHQCHLQVHVLLEVEECREGQSRSPVTRSGLILIRHNIMVPVSYCIGGTLFTLQLHVFGSENLLRPQDPDGSKHFILFSSLSGEL